MAERALEVLPKLYVEAVEEKKLSSPGTKSYDVVKACGDPLFLAKLKFFKRVGKLINPVLKKYQTDRPMLPFLPKDMTNMITDLMAIFIKPEIARKSGVKAVVDLKVDKKELHVAYTKIDVL